MTDLPEHSSPLAEAIKARAYSKGVCDMMDCGQNQYLREKLRAKAIAALTRLQNEPSPSPTGIGEEEMREILAKHTKERGGPQSYIDMLANKFMEIDSELPPELSAPLAAMLEVVALSNLSKRGTE